MKAAHAFYVSETHTWGLMFSGVSLYLNTHLTLLSPANLSVLISAHRWQRHNTIMSICIDVFMLFVCFFLLLLLFFFYPTQFHLFVLLVVDFLGNHKNLLPKYQVIFPFLLIKKKRKQTICEYVGRTDTLHYLQVWKNVTSCTLVLDVLQYECVN